MLHFGKWNWGNSTKKYFGKFEKLAFRKSHEKGVEAQKFFPIERKIWGRTTPKTRFILKILALSEGGGRKFLQKLQKSIFRTFEIFNSNFTAGSLIKFFGHFSAIFAEISDPPPLWKSHNFEKKFHFRGRSNSDFSFNWEAFLNFDALSGPFRKATFLNFP